jgi:hypothetical protein
MAASLLAFIVSNSRADIGLRRAVPRSAFAASSQAMRALMGSQTDQGQRTSLVRVIFSPSKERISPSRCAPVTLWFNNQHAGLGARGWHTRAALLAKIMTELGWTRIRAPALIAAATAIRCWAYARS